MLLDIATNPREQYYINYTLNSNWDLPNKSYGKKP